MNAKTTKFLAVLAVLAMAFAGVAVLAQEQTNDADEVTATTSATYATDYASEAGISAIELETTASPTSVVLYESGMTIEAFNAYYVNADSTIVIPSGADNTWDKAIFMLFVLNGVEINLVTVDPVDENLKWTHTTAVRLVNVASEEDGVITLDAARAGDNKFDVSGYAGEVVSKETGDDNYEDNTAEYHAYTAIDKPLEIGGSDYSVSMKAANTVQNKFYFTDAQVINVIMSGTITGAIPTVNFPYPGLEATFDKVTGTITDGYEQASESIADGSNKLVVEDFTGTIAASETKGEALVFIGDNAGTITEISGNFFLDDGAKISFENGAVIKAKTTFSYIDEYGDTHSFKTTQDITVGLDGFSIQAGEYKIIVSGSAKLSEDTEFAFTGNADLSGMIYTEVKTEQATSAKTLTISNKQADVKIGTFNVVGDGELIIANSVLVTAGKTLNVAGKLTLNENAVLKVAEGAVVKVEGTDGISGTAGNKAQIWNAGRVIANSYDDNAAGALFNVYMNNVDAKGVFFKGTDVYYGNLDAQMPIGTTITDAYGAYLDITGVCKVSLASNVTVDNVLYKYNTMILATFDNTIALTLAYASEYPAEMKLQYKDYNMPAESSAKSTTYRGVVWDDPDNAVISIVAPEEYTVNVVKDSTADPIVYLTSDDVTIVDNVTGKKVTIGEEGAVSLVVDHTYTVTGANDTSNYDFASERLTDLKKSEGTLIEATFTMIRNPGDDPEPIYLEITEGVATVITVTLADEDDTADVVEGIEDGEVFLYYTVERIGEQVFSVAYNADGMTIGDEPKIFSNDKITFFVPGEEKLFFHYEFNFTDETKWENDNGGVTPALATDAADAVAGVTGAATATLPVIMKADKNENGVPAIVSFNGTTDPGQTFTITWKTAAPENVDKELTVSTEEVPVPLYRGEVIVITLVKTEGMDDYRQNMTINDAEYEIGAEYTVTSDLLADNAKGIVLNVDEIMYVKVINSTDLDITITDSTVAKDGKKIFKGETVENAVERLEENLITLASEGRMIISWTYKLTYDEGEPATVTKSNVGASGVINFIETTTEGEGDQPTTTTRNVVSMEIVTINSERIVYWVQINQDENLKYDKYSAGGYMDDVMKVWATPAQGFEITNISVYYWTQESGKGDWYFNAVKEESTGETGTTVWTYVMPASDVLLVPDVEEAVVTATFYDEDEVTVLQEPIEVMKGETATYSGEVPTKEADEKYTYTFAGWSPSIDEPIYEDTVFVATYEATPIVSSDITVAVGQTGANVDFIVYSNDQYAVGSGVIKYKINYVYYDEEFGMEMLGVYEGEKTYTATDDAAAYIKLVVDDIVEQLGDNYLGAYSITGEFQFGEVKGDLNKTIYNPVEA